MKNAGESKIESDAAMRGGDYLTTTMLLPSTIRS